jgi:predicted transcriptional regulator
MAEPSSTMTVRVPDRVRERLDRLAEKTARSRSWLAAEAIASYVELQEWQLGEIAKGIEEADAGRFATDHEVAGVVAKWTRAD